MAAPGAGSGGSPRLESSFQAGSFGRPRAPGVRKLTDKAPILGLILREPATSGECRINPPGLEREERPMRRMWVELVSGIVSAALLAVTIIVPDWIEVLFDEAPDGGDGSLEWVLALTCATVSVLMFALAGRSWRRALRPV